MCECSLCKDLIFEGFDPCVCDQLMSGNRRMDTVTDPVFRGSKCACIVEHLLQRQEDLSAFLEKVGDNPDVCLYLTVTAPDGTYAATRAYWLEELK